MKKIASMMLCLIFVVIPSICMAISYSWTDNTGITGNSYTLDITGNTITIAVLRGVLVVTSLPDRGPPRVMALSVILN